MHLIVIISIRSHIYTHMRVVFRLHPSPPSSTCLTENASPSQGREGEIRHLFRGFAFLHCKKLVENGGMFVCKTRHLVLAGGSKVSGRGRAHLKFNQSGHVYANVLSSVSTGFL